MDNTTATLRMLGQMARLPLDVFVFGMGLFLRSFQSLQSMANHGPGPSAGGPSPDQPMLPAPDPGYSTVPSAMPQARLDATWASVPSMSPPPERFTMDDQDLSTDDLKVVRYRILFTKPDLEFTFEEKQEIVAYTTNGGSFGGLKVGQFVGRVARHQVPRPQIWIDNDYPPNFVPPEGANNWSFPIEDERYIEFQYEVIRREPKQDPNYDRDRNRDLRGIRESIQELASRIQGGNLGGGGGGGGGASSKFPKNS